MKVLKVRSRHKNSNSKKKQSQFSIIFILASQYRSHSVLLSSAVYCEWSKITKIQFNEYEYMVVKFMYEFFRV